MQPLYAADFPRLLIQSQILFIVFCAYEITGVHYGTGRHIPDIDMEDIPKAMQVLINHPDACRKLPLTFVNRCGGPVSRSTS